VSGPAAQHTCQSQNREPSVTGVRRRRYFVSNRMGYLRRDNRVATGVHTLIPLAEDEVRSASLDIPVRVSVAEKSLSWSPLHDCRGSSEVLRNLDCEGGEHANTVSATRH